MTSNKLKMQLIEAVTYKAFEMHYNATKRENWRPAKEHWDDNKDARNMWSLIVTSVVLVLRQIDASPAPDAKTLPGLGAPFPPAIDPGRAGHVKGTGVQVATAEAMRNALDVPPGLATVPFAGPAPSLLARRRAEEIGKLPSPADREEAVAAAALLKPPRDTTYGPDAVVPTDDPIFKDDPRPCSNTQPIEYAAWKARNFWRLYGGSSNVPEKLRDHLREQPYQPDPNKRGFTPK